jgi:site-specific recombinase XerD
MSLEKLKLIKYPCFLLIQEMFAFRGVSMIDAYLHGISESTLKSYKSGWKIFVYFLVEENYNNSDWEDKSVCQEIYSEFLNWVFVGKVLPTSLNITCSAISKFFTVFIPNFDFAQSNYVKSIKKGLMKDKPKNPRYSNIWNPDILLNYYQNENRY